MAEELIERTGRVTCVSVAQDGGPEGCLAIKMADGAVQFYKVQQDEGLHCCRALAKKLGRRLRVWSHSPDGQWETLESFAPVPGNDGADTPLYPQGKPQATCQTKCPKKVDSASTTETIDYSPLDAADAREVAEAVTEVPGPLFAAIRELAAKGSKYMFVTPARLTKSQANTLVRKYGYAVSYLSRMACWKIEWDKAEPADTVQAID